MKKHKKIKNNYRNIKLKRRKKGKKENNSKRLTEKRKE